MPIDSHKTAHAEDLHSKKKTNLITHDHVQCYFGLLELGLIVVRSTLLAWCAHAFDFCPVERQMFQQQLDVCRAWFIKDDVLTVKSISPFRIVQCLSSFSAKPNVARFLRIMSTFDLSKISSTTFSSPANKMSSPGLQTVEGSVLCTFFRTDCSFRFGTRLQQSSYSRSRRIHEPHLPSHGVFEEVVTTMPGFAFFLRQSNVQFTRSWWMEMCSGYVQHEQLDVQFPPMSSSTGLNPMKNMGGEAANVPCINGSFHRHSRPTRRDRTATLLLSPLLKSHQQNRGMFLALCVRLWDLLGHVKHVQEL